MKLKKIELYGVEGSEESEIIIFDSVGKITSLVGANSSGKTTLLRVIKRILQHLASKEFNSVIKVDIAGEDRWTLCEKAIVIFENEDKVFEIPPLGGCIGGSQNEYIEFEIQQDLKKKEWIISRIKSQNGEIKLITNDLQKIFDQENPSIKPLQVELDHIKNKISIQEKSSQKRIAESELKISNDSLARVNEKLSQAKVELIIFQNSQTSVNVSVSKKELLNFMSKIKVPSVYYIPFGRNPSETIEKLINEAVVSRKNKRNTLHQNIEKELGEILQSKVDIFEDEKGIRHLQIAGKPYDRISHGAQVCLYYYSFIFESEANSIVFWDEPENGLHSTRRYKLFELFKKDTRQFIIATHSSELSPVLDAGCEVYSLSSRYDIEKDLVSFQMKRATNRRDAFEVLENLGVIPSKVLFTSNVVVWVEGPSDLLFWRHFINERAIPEGLVEGFDYTFMFYGGTNLFHTSISEEITNDAADILSVNKNSAFIVDSDLSAQPANGNYEDCLKPAAKNMLIEISKINGTDTSKELCFFSYSAGREIENYLPNSAIVNAVKGLHTYTANQLQILNLESFTLNQYSRYFESLENHFLEKDVRSVKNNERALGVSKWGESNKVKFMAKALEGLSVNDLQYNGADEVDRLYKWIKSWRNGV